ncbi:MULTISPECIES: RNA polymerase sigma factor [Streptomyces]|uniref:RNA polymerase subunit sigma n=1 Tax=Streptomyces dengpaensis TaxID=2049881 RepID=A0ABN5IHA5_9ACTN|nr:MULTISPECIES: sigma-70 family RNA polymerase sigma factor [Streptomyces]AVH61830.1 RNA polymerase subunit sigma [Streptomyces dengpaensis]PIB04549.1 RNA polymerase subunit sigma [Streptomyces sp. HG99]
MTATDTTTRRTSEAEEPVTDIVDRARGGDREAFGVLYARYRPQIYTYLLRRTHDQQLSEDLTGDVFVRALARIGAFTWRGSDFGAWLATIARNLLLDHYKSSRYRREVPTGDMYDQDLAVGDIGEQVTEHLARTDVLAELRKALAGLTPDQWECLWLRYWHDLPFGEIGERMDRSMYAAKMLKERALQNLSTPEIKAALLEAASGSRSDSPSQACAAPQASPRVPSPRRPAPSNHLDSGRTRPMATDAMPAALTPLTASQAVALVLLRDGLTERSITQRTGIVGDTLYRLAAAHGITALHGTVEGHRCHEAAGTEPCDGCSLADARDQARTRARHRRSVSSLPRALRRQATGRRRRATR